MGDITSLGNENYLLIPLDEKPFEIDANSRIVTVPSDFIKCGAVRNDNLCEIATFRIARYYDFQDLADCDIAIQWVNADGEEGVSWAFGKDVAGEPGYIRFGWALTEAVTKSVGNVKFAIRFFRKAEGSNKFDYLLNTLTASIVVKDTLAVGDGAVEEKNVINLFNKIVTNGQNPMYATPAEPSFAPAAGGIDFEQGQHAAIGEDNTLALDVMAVTKDNSHITYQWYYVPSADTNSVVAIADDKGEVYEVITNWVKVEEFPEVRDLTKYYVGDGELKTLYTGDIPPVEGTSLYVPHSQLKFLDVENEVTGEYYVEAVSSLLDIDDSNTANPNKSKIRSNKVSVLPPLDVEILEDLPDHVFVGEDVKLVIADDAREPAVSYKWQYSTTSAEDGFSAKGDIAEDGFSAADAGWYRVGVESKLNRTIKTADSSVCLVTEHAAAPTLKADSGLEYSFDGGETWAKVEEGTIIDSDKDRTEIWLRVNIDDEGLNQFNKGVISYSWRIQETDTNIIKDVTEDMIAANDVIIDTTEYGTNVLKIFQRLNSDSYNFYCKVTNTFWNESESLDTIDLGLPFTVK